MDTAKIPFQAYKGTDPYIFVSYAHKDTDRVFPLIAEFHKAGFPIWYDEGIDPGNEWPEEIGNAVLKCSLFIVFISPSAASSKNVVQEINYALTKNRPFIHIWLEDTTLNPGLEMQITTYQGIFHFRMEPENFHRKCHQAFESFKIKRTRAQTKPEIVETRTPPAPEAKPPVAAMTPPVTASTPPVAANKTTPDLEIKRIVPKAWEEIRTEKAAEGIVATVGADRKSRTKIGRLLERLELVEINADGKSRPLIGHLLQLALTGVYFFMLFKIIRLDGFERIKMSLLLAGSISLAFGLVNMFCRGSDPFFSEYVLIAIDVVTVVIDIVAGVLPWDSSSVLTSIFMAIAAGFLLAIPALPGVILIFIGEDIGDKLRKKR